MSLCSGLAIAHLVIACLVIAKHLALMVCESYDFLFPLLLRESRQRDAMRSLLHTLALNGELCHLWCRGARGCLFLRTMWVEVETVTLDHGRCWCPF
jgi:hypothetical protein